MFRRIFTNTRVHTQSRKFGGHAAPAPPAGGIGGLVAKYLPENHHVSIAMLIFYGLLVTVGSLSGGSKKAAPAPAIAHTSSTPAAPRSSDIPAFDSPEFGTWLGTPGNLEKAVQKLLS